MKSWLELCLKGGRFCANCAFSFACWTLWLLLGLLLAGQVGIAVSHEVAVPGFVLRAFEQRLAASQVRVNFGRATFDPSGALIIENLSVYLPGINEPVGRVRAALIELDPWALLSGRFEPRVLRATGANIFVPAMLSPSAQSEKIIGDLEFTCSMHEQDLLVEHFTAHLAGIGLSAHGAIRLKTSSGNTAPLPIADYLAHNYTDLCRKAVTISERLAGLQQPALHIELIPSDRRGAIAIIGVHAAALDLTAPWPVHAKDLAASTRLPLLGGTFVHIPLQFSVEEINIAGVKVRGASGQIRGGFKPADLSFHLRTAEITAREISSRGFGFTSLSAHLQTDSLPQLDGEVTVWCAGEPTAFLGQADLAAKTATLHFDGALSPALLVPIGKMLGRDVRPFVNFDAPVALHADATFAGDWKFKKLTGHVAAKKIDAYRVPIDTARGNIEFDGRHFLAHHAMATLGGNFARGSFEQDLKTREFRFLLDGQLRPLAISGWFHDWWPDFFNHFGFPVTAPEANVDVAGWWGSGYKTTVFVFAESATPVIRDAKFDYGRTLLFIRPNFIDALEFFGTHGLGEARGTFVREVDFASGMWRRLDFAAKSSVDLGVAAKIFGPDATARLAPFNFENPPLLTIAGHLDGPAAQDGAHQRITIEAQSGGAFKLHDFPLRNLAFHAVQNDDEVVIDGVQARFADGLVTGKTRIWGRGAERCLQFDASLAGANLAQAIAIFGDYTAKRKGQPPPAPGKFLRGKANVKLDLSSSAEGHYDDPYSYKGTGRAALAGPGLGEVQLLGLLSELLNFTSLRFTSARADFTIDRTKLVFPEVNVTGANSAIQGRGTYTLDQHALDFNARVYPFHESKFFLQNVMGAVLSPLSTVLEVKLTGNLDKPSWAFVMGPTNFFRTLLTTSPHPAGAKTATEQPESYRKR